MKNTAFLRLLLFTAMLATLSAQTTETFDSGANILIDSSQTTGAGTFLVQNGRLEFVTTGPSTANDAAQVFYSPGANLASASPETRSMLVGQVDTDWSVSVQAHVADFGAMAADQGFFAGIQISQLQNTLFDHGLFARAGDHIWNTELNAIAGTWGNHVFNQVAAIGTTEFLLHVDYASATHILTGAVSTDGGSSWLTSISFDVTQTTASGGWDMVTGFTGSSFGVALAAGSNDLTVNPGDISFDSFTYSGLTVGSFPAYASAVPEPSTWAALAGLVGLAMASRKRMQARLRIPLFIAVIAGASASLPAQTATVEVHGTIYDSYTYLGTGLTSIIPVGSGFTATWTYDLSSVGAGIPASYVGGMQVGTRYDFSSFTTAFVSNGYTCTTDIGSGGPGITIFDSNPLAGTYDGFVLRGATSGVSAPTQNTFYLNSISLQLLTPDLSTFTDQSLSHVLEGEDFLSQPPGANNLLIVSAQSPTNVSFHTELYGSISSYSYSVAAVPEPSTWALVVGLAGLVFAVWRKFAGSNRITRASRIVRKWRAGTALAAAALFVFIANRGSAQTVRLQFSGILTSYGGSPTGAFMSAFPLNSSYSLTYTLPLGMPDGSPGLDVGTFGNDADYPFAITLVTNGLTFTSAQTGTVYVYNNNSGGGVAVDGFGISVASVPVQNGFTPSAFSASLYSTNLSLFSSDSEENLAGSWTRGDFDLSGQPGYTLSALFSFQEGIVGGSVTGVTAVAAVPEPSTYPAILGGVALMGVAVLRRRRRRRRPSPEPSPTRGRLLARNRIFLDHSPLSPLSHRTS